MKLVIPRNYALGIGGLVLVVIVSGSFYGGMKYGYTKGKKDAEITPENMFSRGDNQLNMYGSMPDGTTNYPGGRSVPGGMSRRYQRQSNPTPSPAANSSGTGNDSI